MGKVIDLDAGGDVGVNNATNLHEVSGELPSEYVIRQVDGNRTEDAPDYFTAQLEKRSLAIAERVKHIRSFVTSNAEALTNAVAALRESDQLSADAAAQATALIDDVTSGKTLNGGAAAGASAGGSLGASAGAKQIFGA